METEKHNAKQRNRIDIRLQACGESTLHFLNILFNIDLGVMILIYDPIHLCIRVSVSHFIFILLYYATHIKHTSA